MHMIGIINSERVRHAGVRGRNALPDDDASGVPAFKKLSFAAAHISYAEEALELIGLLLELDLDGFSVSAELPCPVEIEALLDG
jgi:hypothetical protein